MYKLMKKFGNRQRGLTLLELLGVIVIIAILAAVLITRINASMDKARETGIKNDFRAFTLATETALQESTGVTADGNTLEEWVINENLDPAMTFKADGETEKKVDPWKNTYTITFAQATDPASATGTSANDALIAVTSAGKDKTVGTADDFAMYTYLYQGQVSTCTVGYSGDKNQTTELDLTGDCGTAVTVTP